MSSIPFAPIDYSSKDYLAFRADLLASVPNYLPEWTNQTPGDFGVVLVELFSYIADILSYYGDRIANEAYLATAVQRSSVLKIAALMDYQPSDNVASTAALSLGLSATAGPTVLPKGTQFATRASISAPPLVFETTQDLIFNANARTFTDGATTSGSATVTSPTQAQFTANDQGLAITGPGIPAGTTVLAYVSPTQITLSVNATATASGLTMTVARTSTLSVTQDNSVPPRPITVVQGKTVSNEALGNSLGVADQVFTLFQSPVIQGSVIVFVDEGSGPKQWTRFDHITDAGSSDPAYTTFTDDNSIVNVVFGDGVYGRIPNPQAVISATYRVGGGLAGNVGAHTILDVLSAQPNVVAVDNPSPAFGGDDAETLDHIRVQAPKSLTAINRAVTLGDYAALALKLSAIAKARATGAVFTAVNLYIHPAGGFLSAANLANSVAAYGALLTYPTRTSVDGVTIIGSLAITSVQMNFTQADVGKSISGAGIPTGTTIRSVTPARTFADGATVNGNPGITSPALANFTQADVNKIITGAGIPSNTTILSVQSPTAATLSANATATASGVAMTIPLQAGLSANSTASATGVTMTVVGTNRGYLDDKKMIGASVTVLPPQYQGTAGYVPIYIALQVAIFQQYDFSLIQQAVLFAINDLLSFPKVDFAMKITRSAVHRAVQSVEGVDYVILTELRRGDQTPSTVQDIFCVDYEIPNITAAAVTQAIQ